MNEMWCSWHVWQVATGEPLIGFEFRLHVARQEVSFSGEAVGGTVRDGVAGWGVRRCRGQRLKLAKLGM